MLGTQNLTLFIVSGILLNITPGQDTLYIVGRSISQGRRAGLLSVLGIMSGCVVHTLAAAFGLSAILATSASAFLVIKLIGAAYLVYLGCQMLWERPAKSAAPTEKLPAASAWRIFRAGLLTNVLNPKVAIFFLAFLPQFIDPAAEHKTLAFLFLGAVFLFNGTIWCLMLAWCAALASRRLRESSRLGAWIRRTTGAVFVGLGIKLAVSE